MNDVFGQELEKKNTQVLSEVEARALTPPPEQVDEQTKLIDNFNSINEHLGIIYSPSIYEKFVSLYNLVVSRLQK